MLGKDHNNNTIEIMPTTVTQTSKQYLEYIAEKEFNNIDLKTEYIYGYARKLINALKEIGLFEKAQEFENDLKQV